RRRHLLADTEATIGRSPSEFEALRPQSAAVIARIRERLTELARVRDPRLLDLSRQPIFVAVELHPTLIVGHAVRKFLLPTRRARVRFTGRRTERERRAQPRIELAADQPMALVLEKDLPVLRDPAAIELLRPLSPRRVVHRLLHGLAEEVPILHVRL